MSSSSLSLIIVCAVESKKPGNPHLLIHNYSTCFFFRCYLSEGNLTGPLSGLVKWRGGKKQGVKEGVAEELLNVEVSGGR